MLFFIITKRLDLLSKVGTYINETVTRSNNKPYFFFCMGVQIPHREIACLKLTERHGAYWNNDTASQPADCSCCFCD